MTYTHDTKHLAEGLALFARQFRNAANLRALASAYLTQVQSIEDALWQILSDTLDTAVGSSLDVFGLLLGFARGKLGDDDYRAVLRGVVRARVSNGTAEDVIAVARAVLGATAFDYVEGHASITISPLSELGFDAASLATVLQLAKAGGVQIQVIALESAIDKTFTLGDLDAYTLESDSSHGFSDVAMSTGGHLTGAY